MFEPVNEPPAAPPGERWIRESGARRFARTMRERWLIIMIAFVAATAAALFYVSSAKPVYEAEADLLISPATDPSLSALNLIRGDPNVPTSGTQTAALVVHTPDIAAEAARLLNAPEPQTLLQRVQVAPVAGSDVLAVTASASTPTGAARLANAFAQATIDVRSRLLQAQLRTAIPRLQAQIKQSPQSNSATAADSLGGQLAALQALQGAPDPTIQLGTPASAPGSPVSPRRTLSLAAGGILGLVLGIAIALAADALDPRLRRESQLQGVLDLPVLARMPSSANGEQRRSDVDVHWVESLVTAHEFLAEAVGGLDRASVEHKRTIVFTPVHRDAESTNLALHHAWLLAAAGERVVLIDGDPRDPAVGLATGAQPSPHVKHVLAGSRPIQEALVTVEAKGVKLRVLAIHERLDPNSPFLMPMGREMIVDLLHDADVLVVDAPPLTQSARALVLARSADRIVVVARIGETRLAELRELSELFAGHDVRGAGIVLVGGRTGSGGRGRDRALREALTPDALRFRVGPRDNARPVRDVADTGPMQPLLHNAAGTSRKLRYSAGRVAVQGRPARQRKTRA